MCKVRLEAYKEGTKERFPIASSKQIKRLEEVGVSFGDTMIFFNNFNLIRNFLLDDNRNNAEKLKELLKKENKPLIIKAGTDEEAESGEDVRYSTSYTWSAENCNGGWFIIIAKV